MHDVYLVTNSTRYIRFINAIKGNIVKLPSPMVSRRDGRERERERVHILFFVIYTVYCSYYMYFCKINIRPDRIYI